MPTNIQPIHAQRRLAEVGRIRLGKKIIGTRRDGSEYTRPAKLDRFRLTSRDKARLDSAAELYGGTVEAWDGQWELYTDADVIPIAVVPHQALNVSYELWGQKTINGKKSPVICLRRCDGEFEAKSDGPCLCVQQPEMTCKPTARLSVVLTDVPGLGVWRLESHGWNALTELQGTVELLEALVSIGRPVRARLRLDKRESPNEEGTRKFVVPVIDIDHTLGQVLDALGQGVSPDAIEVGNAGESGQRGMTPVPALPAAERPSVRDQVAAAGEIERPKRANAAEPIRPTGIQPRKVAEFAGDGAADATPVDDEVVTTVSSTSPGEGSGPSEATAPPSDDEIARARTSVVLAIKEIDESDEYRHRFLLAYSDGKFSSANDVPVDEVAAVRATAVRVRRNAIRLEDGGGGPFFRDLGTGFPSSDPGGQSPARRGGPVAPDVEAAAAQPEQATVELIDRDWWMQQIASVVGVGQASLLRAARSLAADLGVTVPGAIDEITDPQLVAAVRGWLDEKAAA